MSSSPPVVETVAFPVIHCLRCGASYVARTEALPKTCSRCKSPYWNRELTRRIDAKCPLCPWHQRYLRDRNALLGIEDHIRKVHGEEALAELGKKETV